MKFHSPQSVDEAIGLLAADPDAKILAGGTDLLVRLRSRDVAPSAVIDIKRIDALTTISQPDGRWRIGAAVPSAEMNEHAGLKAAWPGVVEAADLIGSTQVQGRATVTGNLCNAGPAADSVPAMVAAGAMAEVAGPDGTRLVPVEDIPTAPGKTSLKQGEMVTAITLPGKPANSGDAYLRFIPRTEMDIAVVGVGIALTMDGDTIKDAKVALGAVGPKVIVADAAAKALIGTTGDEAALDALAEAASAAATPIDDKRGTAEFRRDVTGVMAKRTAKIAIARAKGEA
ncbi:xanthine dehydrogenase family protein subunit M [Alisedimentitalea sp. MJ-SS2]|uniref:FAD binding domain-containing protein n=1 Tax=Aliisedimentitalea sp. MJ-SS2 TaxID=3049795 RepID=UPI00290A6207|nr:xanthine dehydrogenase family protein subunit M [Alisedimentitalea sp. MJ-SS2]MDU8927419.1 xanthine dehydrogenase family protein subunit M [Alisedimentitalea sp. MJ-SS2]